MSSYRFKHLTLDDRITIQKSLKEGKTFVETGALLGKDPSTISKEVKNHFEWRHTGTRSRGFNPCIHRRKCTKTNICIEQNISVECSYMAWKRYSYCSQCANCVVHCPEFIEEKCSKLEKAPYVCNACNQVRSCTLSKRYYDAKEANKAYERTRSDSRVKE